MVDGRLEGEGGDCAPRYADHALESVVLCRDRQSFLVDAQQLLANCRPGFEQRQTLVREDPADLSVKMLTIAGA